MPPLLRQILGRKPGQTHFHFQGICGIAMGQLAIALQNSGYRVSGSDGQSDPPMGSRLAAAGISILSPDAVPSDYDLRVVGRAIELDELSTDDRLTVSLPELMAELTQKTAQRVVVAGTKGKTTTTAMLSWIAERAGLQPDFLIGGVTGNFPNGIRLHDAALAILEGDETFSSPTDRTPKFRHYRPTAAVLTNIYPDHVELYPDFREYSELFQNLLADLPGAGFAVVCSDAGAQTRPALAASAAPVTTVGWEAGAALRITDYIFADGCAEFHFLGCRFFLPLRGRANALDAALAAAAAQLLGIEPQMSAEILREFLPVHERLEHVGTPGGVRLFVESNAHPAALKNAVEALSPSSSRLLCIVQPQTPGAGDGYVQNTLPTVLAGASHVLIAPPANQSEGDFTPPFSCERLVGALCDQNVAAVYCDTRRGIIRWVCEHARPGDSLLLAVHAPSRALLVDEITRALQKT